MVQLKNAATPKVERKDNMLDAAKVEAIKLDAPKKTEDGSISKPGLASATAAAS